MCVVVCRLREECAGEKGKNQEAAAEIYRQRQLGNKMESQLAVSATQVHSTSTLLQIVDSFKKCRLIICLLMFCRLNCHIVELFVFAACNLHCSCLHKQSLCYSMNFRFLSNLSRKYCCEKMFILKVFILIQLLSTANAKDIKTDYYITNSTLASRYHGSVT